MPRTKQERLEYCQTWQKKLESDYSALATSRSDARLYFDADPSIVDVIENRSKITTTDMQDAIDMAKPDILETIAGIDEPLKLDPSEARYVDPVKKLQVLGNVMVKRKNKWFRICSDFLDDAMILKFGCIKYRWVKEEKTTEKTYEGLADIELAELLLDPSAQMVEDGGLDAARITVISRTIIDEYVRYDGVPAERIKFPLDTKDFANSPIVIEEIRLYEHEFIRDYGQEFFDKVKAAVDTLKDSPSDTEFEERFRHVGGIEGIYDSKNNKYRTFECYFWEGVVPWVLTYSADQVMLDEKNKYGKAPYRGGSPFLVAHSLIGKGYYDLLREIQRHSTFLERQAEDIVVQNNFRRYFVDIEGAQMNIDDYENNSAMNALIRCNAGGRLSDYILPEPKIPLGNDFLVYLDRRERIKDAHSVTGRAFSGLDGGEDERTYRGKQLKVNQASKKLLMMMRAYMEEVFAPLFQDTLDCIAKFMKKSTTIRYLNEDYDISPENIICEYALVVNVGLGSHDKQDLIVKLQQLIGLAMQQMQFGIITPQNLYYMNQELVKAMGFLNTMDFVTDPKLKETLLQFVEAVMTVMQHFTELHVEEPEMQAVVEQMSAMAQQVMIAVGVDQKQISDGGTNSKGTQPGQEPAPLPTNPMNVMNPQTQVSGGIFVA